MSTRGYEHVTLADVLHRQAARAKPSKYRNVRVTLDGRTFASKREAAYYQGLKMRAQLGEITNLRCQVPFPLQCPILDAFGQVIGAVQVSEYVADFVYDEGDVRHIVDVKSAGTRTAVFALKAKWLWLQAGLAIEEV